jgi:hypothetical protein
MNRFPKIDQPCPLAIDAQKRLDGYCTRCERSVHSLDAMSAGEREALLRSACGSICVSYRMPAPRRTTRFGAAMALAMVVLPAAATETPLAGSAPAAETPAAPSAFSDALHPAQVKCKEGEAAATESLPIESITITGGVSHPGDAEWVDADDSLPDLPVVTESRSDGG